MSTVNRSERAALFVFLALLVALAVGLGLYFRYADDNGIPLLAACTLAATFLVVATGQLLRRLQRGRKVAEQYGVPESRVLRWLSRRQWLTLMVGLTVITLGTGSLTGMSVLAGEQTPVANPTVAPPPTPAPTTPPPPTTEAPTPSPTADPTLTPSESADPFSPTPDDPGLSPEPAPGATTYLDSAELLAGDHRAKPVTFSNVRYPRSISLYCQRATSTFLQWNVAGHVRFDAVAGIDDGTPGAFGITAELIFYDQDGRRLVPKPVDVSVGHPQKITIDLTGVVNLRMTCAGRNTRTNNQDSTYVGLGDPVIVNG